MGNWRTVQIEGTCAAGEVAALRKALTYDRNTMAGFHPLVNGGICGLPNWAGEKISARGNLAERGYDADDVAETLKELSTVAPSLAVKVHIGGDYETDECVNTVMLAGGEATIGAPERKTIDKPSEDQMRQSAAY